MKAEQRIMVEEKRVRVRVWRRKESAVLSLAMETITQNEEVGSVMVLVGVEESRGKRDAIYRRSEGSSVRWPLRLVTEFCL